MKPPKPALRAAVVELRNQGLSYRQIGRRLSISTNTVAGQCNRARAAGVHVEQFGHFGPQPPRPASPCVARRRHRAGVRKAVNEALGVATAAPPPPRPSFPLPPGARTCQFIAGVKGTDFNLYADPGVFCGKAVLEGSAYCPNCHRKTHMRPYTKEVAPFVPGTAGTVDTAWQ